MALQFLYTFLILGVFFFVGVRASAHLDDKKTAHFCRCLVVVTIWGVVISGICAVWGL